MAAKSPEAIAHRLQHDREYRNRPERRAIEIPRRKRLAQTTLGKLKNYLAHVRWKLRHRPSKRLRISEQRLIAEIERLKHPASPGRTPDAGTSPVSGQ